MPESAKENKNVVEPEVFIATTLDDISHKLSNLQTILSEQIPLGKVLNIPDGILITGDTYVYFLKGRVILPGGTTRDIPSYRRALFSISIENEGPDDCTVVINPDETWGKRTVNSGETFELDMKKAAIREVKLSVAAGASCTVQISGVV
ncbi:MAG: hypothetical protein KJ714_05600 [Euryarchaeota archaeon]|nr:hypothetical protein [Euryarchaeota archaeon]